MRPALFLTAALLLAAATGCETSRVHRLTPEVFPPTASEESIKLFVNQVRRPHIRIAHIQSTADISRDPEVRRAQLEQLRAEARALGADAVMDIQQLQNRVRGMVIDERVPFRAYRQGNYELYFLRGTAIRFVDEEAAAAFVDPLRPPTDEADRLATDQTPTGIPTISSRDPEEDQPLETIPRGLGPRP